jgi:endonuclease-3
MGMFRQKTKNIIGLSKKLVADHREEVPRSLSQLIELPGVGRKTANVVLGVAWNTPEGVVVDTHVQRIAQRLGWTRETTPEKIEQDLMAMFPKENWDMLSHVLIFHGRRVCFARKPSCATCVVNDICPSAFHAENVGRKSSLRLAARLDGVKPTLKRMKAKQARQSKASASKATAAGAKRPAKSPLAKRPAKALTAKPPPA